MVCNNTPSGQCRIQRTMDRRAFLATLSASLAQAAAALPANKNIKWAVSAGLWGHYPVAPFTDILDVMKDTGFIGVRLTGYPGILKTYNITASQLEKEVAKRNLHVATISFGGPADDESKHAEIIKRAKEAMAFLKIFGADRLVVFSPGRKKEGEDVSAAFKTMCSGFNRIGEAAGEMGFKAGLHNHLNQMVERPEEVHRCMEL